MAKDETSGAPETGLRILTRKSIAAATDLGTEIVATPEWGEGTGVQVRALDVNRRLAWFAFISERQVNDKTGRREQLVDPFKSSDAALVALGIIDEQGEPVYTLADIEELGAKSPKVIGRIATVVARLSGIGQEAATSDGPKSPTSDGSPTDSLDTSE